MKKENVRRFILGILVILGWFALISQFYLSLLAPVHTAAERILNYFSYFTIQINLLVAITSTVLFTKGMNSTSFFAKEKSLVATVAYITIVGITYNLILRGVWAPEGLQKLTDELLHTVIPILFVGWWIAYAPKASLKWRDARPLMIYPLAYACYTLLHGLIANWYPYPFIDPNNVGWNSVIINSILVMAAFLIVSLIYIRIGKLRS